MGKCTERHPIKTAPRDGTQIIVPSQFSGLDADIAAYDPSCPSGFYWWSVKTESPIDEPEFWMPIPKWLKGTANG